jgi:hypothetical protein
LEAQDALFDLVEAGEVRRRERLSGEDREVDLDLFGADLLVDAGDALARVQPPCRPSERSGRMASSTSERHTVVPVTVGLSGSAR